MNKYPLLKIKINKRRYIQDISDSIKKNKMTMGPKCFDLEKKIANFLKVKNVILTTSGTNALMMATILSNLKPFDKVIISNLAWVAATNPVLIMGGNINVVDTMPGSEIIDYNKLNEAIIKIRPKLVILVHLNGQAKYNKKFDQLKKKYKFFVIEDAAQALLTKSDFKKKSCGTFYDVGCYSLSITKPIHMVYGGFCATNNDKYAKYLKAVRSNGVPNNKKLKKKLSTSKGLNLKPSDIHAAIGLFSLRNAQNFSKTLSENYKEYEKSITNKKIKMIKLQGRMPIPNYATAIVQDIKRFFLFCQRNLIEVSHGVTTITETKTIRNPKNNLNNSIFISNNLVRLPFGTGYKKSEIRKICKILNKF